MGPGSEEEDLEGVRSERANRREDTLSVLDGSFPGRESVKEESKCNAEPHEQEDGLSLRLGEEGLRDAKVPRKSHHRLRKHADERLCPEMSSKKSSRNENAHDPVLAFSRVGNEPENELVRVILFPVSRIEGDSALSQKEECLPIGHSHTNEPGHTSEKEEQRIASMVEQLAER